MAGSSAAESTTAPTDGEILWDRVVAIEPCGIERVFDIEVEGAHNFIGNRIVAHNTYISGPLRLSAG